MGLHVWQLCIQFIQQKIYIGVPPRYKFYVITHNIPAMEIKALWNGDLNSVGGDHSSADLALVNRLAYWTNGDEAQMDRLFRQSGLYASMKEEHGIKKWDRRHGGGTYGEMTIAKALKGFVPYRQEIRAPLAPHPPANVKTASPEQTSKEVEP